MIRVFTAMKPGTQGIFLVSQCERIMHNHDYELTPVTLYTKDLSEDMQAYLVKKGGRAARYSWHKCSRENVRMYPAGEKMFFTEGHEKNSSAAYYRKKVAINLIRGAGGCKQKTYIGAEARENSVLFAVVMVEVPS